jgi:hypothetical protein
MRRYSPASSTPSRKPPRLSRAQAAIRTRQRRTRSPTYSLLQSSRPRSRTPATIAATLWFEEILATLCGALAAGAVAWFLFGAAPQRMYG